MAEPRHHLPPLATGSSEYAEPPLSTGWTAMVSMRVGRGGPANATGSMRNRHPITPKSLFCFGFGVCNRRNVFGDAETTGCGAGRRAPVPLPRRGGGCRVRLSGNALLLAEIAPVGRWRSRILFGYLARMRRLVISMFLAFRYYDWYGDGTASTLRGCRSTRLRTRWMPSLVRR